MNEENNYKNYSKTGYSGTDSGSSFGNKPAVDHNLAGYGFQPPQPPMPPKKNGRGGLIAGIIVTGTALLIALVVLGLLVMRLVRINRAADTVSAAAEIVTEITAQPDTDTDTDTDTGAEPAEQADYTDLVTTDSETFIGDDEYSVPHINWDSTVTDAINETISNYCYPRIEQSQSEYDSNGYPFTSGGMWYDWWMNGDILTLILWDFVYPDASGWDDPQIWCLDFSDPDTPYEMTKDDILAYFDLSEDEYIALTEKALGNAFCGRYDGAMGYDTDFTQEQFDRTTTAENAGEAVPYLGENGSLWVNGWIYALAGGERYPGQTDVLDTDYSDAYLQYTGG